MTLDTNIVIAYLGGEQRVIERLSEWRHEGMPLFLSTVAESEVLSFSGWSPAERRATEEFLEENFTSIPFDRMAARIAARLRRESKIKFPDAAIAATAIVTHSPLVTRNTRDFQKIAGLSVLVI